MATVKNSIASAYASGDRAERVVARAVVETTYLDAAWSVEPLAAVWTIVLVCRIQLP